MDWFNRKNKKIKEDREFRTWEREELQKSGTNWEKFLKRLE